MELGEIFDRHWQRVWRAAYAVSGDRGLASDAAQDAFVRAGAALHRFDRRRPIEPWLVRIAVNRAVDLVRARRRGAGEDELPETFAFDPPLPDEALRRLGPERRAMIALHYWLDYTTPEIAEILGAMSDDLERRLREAGHRLPGPTDLETHAARTRVLAARRRPRLLPILAAAVLAGGAFGVGYAVASGGTPKPKVVVKEVPARLAAGPGFLPAEGWTVHGSTATSGSGIRVDAAFQPASMVPGLSERLLPLQLPASGRLRAHVGAYAVQVTVTYPGTPSAGELVAACEEVGRIVVPSCPSARPTKRGDIAAAIHYVLRWLPANYPGARAGSRRRDSDRAPRPRHAALRRSGRRLRGDRRVEQLRGRRRPPDDREGQREPVAADVLRREDRERLDGLGAGPLRAPVCRGARDA